MEAKLSAELNKELEKMGSSDLLDVILAVRPHPISSDHESRSRNEKITALKEAFDRDVAPVEKVVREIGGHVIGRAWINHTLKARVPAQSLKELAAHEEIAAVDIPHALVPERV